MSIGTQHDCFSTVNVLWNQMSAYLASSSLPYNTAVQIRIHSRESKVVCIQNRYKLAISGISNLYRKNVHFEAQKSGKLILKKNWDVLLCQKPWCLLISLPIVRYPKAGIPRRNFFRGYIGITISSVLYRVTQTTLMWRLWLCRSVSFLCLPTAAGPRCV